MYWVRKGEIGGSPIPYTRDEIEEWKRNGVKRVLILPEDWEIEEAWGSVDYYYSTLNELGLEYLHVRIPDGHPPKMNQFTSIFNWLRKGKGNLVHCIGGMGRTGTIIASYLVLVEGLDAESAIEEVRRYKPGAIQTYEQELFVFEIERLKEKWKIHS
ncbi:dual specificity protein phosphatase family protein [Stygiolobus caldivivus]|uniref:Protein phosphatase n=1 Tax=Stygiolobus caldivivus TaxID=2824673 RepID=A0A8D5ZJR2_9CREN|nr:dual specificity protein phosphatase family protein [Stygiolobus caldivivus]BCU70457.1 protein phosphatase [Stygiolobus caldivivus]